MELTMEEITEILIEDEEIRRMNEEARLCQIHEDAGDRI